MNLYIKKATNMKVIIGIIYALIPALLMSVPIGLFDPYAGLLIFLFFYVWFGFKCFIW